MVNAIITLNINPKRCNLQCYVLHW